VNTLAGKESGNLRFVRLPVMIQFWFRKAISGDSGKINVPIMDIKYLDVSMADLRDSAKSIQFTFASNYIIDFSTERNAIVIVFVVFASIIFLIAVFKTRAWYTRNHQSADVVDIMVIQINNSTYFELCCIFAGCFQFLDICLPPESLSTCFWLTRPKLY
jgi:hypothetical protein